MTDKNPIQVADRLFHAVELLADRGPMSLTEISGELSLNKSTAHRVLSSLDYMGYVKQSAGNGKYELTFKIVELSNHLVSKVDVLAIVRPYLKELMEISEETVHFVERDGTDAVYIDKVECYKNSVQMGSRIGSRIPIYRSGVGKAMAAAMRDSDVKELWAQSKIEAVTPHTITNYDVFLQELNYTRQRGYALDNEENEPGVRCIAAALDCYWGPSQYAFSISAPVNRMDYARVRKLSRYVLDTKARIDQAFR